MISRKVFLVVNLVLVAAIVSGGVYLGVTMVNAPPAQQIPQGVAFDARYISSTQVKVEFDSFPHPISYTDTSIRIVAPNGGVSMANVTSGITQYVQSASSRSLSMIVVSATGPLEEGSYFIMVGDRDLIIGAWSFEMTYKYNGAVISQGTVIVPNPDTTPQGSFDAANRISPGRMDLVMGVVTPSTHISYCKVVVQGPEGFTKTVELNRTYGIASDIGNGTVLEYLDSNEDSLLNLGDAIVLSNDRGLPKGGWSVTVKSIFTGASIAAVSYEIT